MITGTTGYGKTQFHKRYLKIFDRVLLFDPLQDYGDFSYVSLDRLLEIHDQGKLSLPNKFKYAITEPEDVEVLAMLAFINRDMNLGIEEASMVFESKMYVPKSIRNVVLVGRHSGVDISVCAQRAVNIPIILRSQSNRFVSALQTEPLDIQAVGERIGRQSAEQLSELQPMELLDWEPGKGVERYTMEGFVN